MYEVSAPIRKQLFKQAWFIHIFAVISKVVIPAALQSSEIRTCLEIFNLKKSESLTGIHAFANFVFCFKIA